MDRDSVSSIIILESFPTVHIRYSMILQCQKTRKMFKRILTRRDETRHWKTTITKRSGPKTC